jgi:DNA-binding NarL/FixJ family response regulator
VAAVRQNVLVVDDDVRFREFARATIERAGFDTIEAGDADQALAAAGLNCPHLVLLDVRLPRVSGYELYRELRDKLGDAVPIIFVSGERTDSYDRVAGLMLGADDYLVKPFDPDELVARVRRSLRPRANGKAENGAAPEDDPLADLTTREREVLALVAHGKSTRQVAHELVISARTVGTHIQHILAKLGVENRTQAAAVAHRAGLVPPEVTAHILPERAADDQAAKQSREPSLLA